MTRLTWHTVLLCIALSYLSLLSASPAATASQITISDLGPFIAYPKQVVFNAHIASASGTIQKVILVYGVKERTCGTVVAKGFPTFKPSSAVDVNWTWEMLKSGSEPPGAKIWYQWQVTDEQGNVTTTDKQEFTWLDSGHIWKTISRGMILLHWYDEPDDFANTLLDSTTASLQQLSTTTGVAAQFPIDVYIYKSSADLQNATLYQPSWVGGIAFPT